MLCGEGAKGIMLNYMGQKMIGIYGIIKIIIYSHGKGKYSE